MVEGLWHLVTPLPTGVMRFHTGVTKIGNTNIVHFQFKLDLTILEMEFWKNSFTFSLTLKSFNFSRDQNLEYLKKGYSWGYQMW